MKKREKEKLTILYHFRDGPSIFLEKCISGRTFISGGGGGVERDRDLLFFPVFVKAEYFCQCQLIGTGKVSKFLLFLPGFPIKKNPSCYNDKLASSAASRDQPQSIPDHNCETV